MNTKDIVNTDAAFCFCLLMEDKRNESSFISVRKRYDILSISFFMLVCVSIGEMSCDEKILSCIQDDVLKKQLLQVEAQGRDRDSSTTRLAVAE